MNAERLWTIDDLAARWGCDPETAWARVKGGGLPAVWLGPGAYQPGKRGRKLIRFRRESVEAFERRQEAPLLTAAGKGGEGRPVESAPPLSIPGWDGVSRLNRGKRRK